MSTAETEQKQIPWPEPVDQPPNINALLRSETADPVTNLPGHLQEATTSTAQLAVYANMLGNTALQAGANPNPPDINRRGVSTDKTVIVDHIMKVDDKIFVIGDRILPYDDKPVDINEPHVYGIRSHPAHPLIYDKDPLTEGKFPTADQDNERRAQVSPEGKLALANFLGAIALEETEELPQYKKFVTDHFQPQRDAEAKAFLKEQADAKTELFPTATSDDFTPKLLRGRARRGLPVEPTVFASGIYDYRKLAQQEPERNETPEEPPSPRRKKRLRKLLRRTQAAKETGGDDTKL